MNSIKLEKDQAMKRYKKNQFLRKVIHFCQATVFLGLFLSSPLWLPKLCSSLKNFFVPLPYMGTIFCHPKCLFIFCNIIVLFLVGESKLCSSSPAANIDEEDVKQRKILQRVSSSEVDNKYVEEPLVEKSIKNGEEKDEEVEKEEEENVSEQEAEEEEFDAEEEEEENGLPADELYQKAEDFIAMVNKQRSLEAKMLVCSG